MKILIDGVERDATAAEAAEIATAQAAMLAMPAGVPQEISDRQFFHILAVDGLITEAEALAAVKTGDMPDAIETFIINLPEADRFNARMLLEGATTFRRDHPLTNAFGAMYGLTAGNIDDIWRRASTL